MSRKVEYFKLTTHYKGRPPSFRNLKLTSADPLHDIYKVLGKNERISFLSADEFMSADPFVNQEQELSFLYSNQRRF